MKVFHNTILLLLSLRKALVRIWYKIFPNFFLAMGLKSLIYNPNIGKSSKINQNLMTFAFSF